MRALEKVEDRKQKLEDEIENFSEEEVKTKKMAIVEKLSKKIDELYSEL